MVEEDLKIISKNDIKKDKIFLAGHQGLVGSAIFKLLKKGYKNIIVESKKI